MAVANIAAARALYQVQRAALFPTVSAQAAATYGQEPTSVITGGAVPRGSASTYNQRLYSLTAGVSAYQLDLFGKVRNLTRAAQEQYFATREARDAAQITLVSEVAADYLAIGADRALLAIAQDTLRSGTETLAVTKRRFEAGVDSQLAVSQAQTIVQEARFDVARLTTQVAQDRNALDLVVGAPVGEELLPSGIGQPVVVLERLPAAVSSSVLLGRPDVLEAEDQLRGAYANIGAARAAFFPSISLTGSGGLTSLALSTLFNGASATWTFAPTVSQTIFDAGANRGNLAYAKAQRDIGVAKLRKGHPDRLPRGGRRPGPARHHRRTARRPAGPDRRRRRQPPPVHRPLRARRRHLPQCPDRPARALFGPPDPGRQPAGQGDQSGDALRSLGRRTGCAGRRGGRLSIGRPCYFLAVTACAAASMTLATAAGCDT